MKSKFLIPLLAVIFTTAMSFTTARTAVDPDNDYIFRNGNWQMIPEVSCVSGASDCQVTVNPDGLDYTVYDSQSFGDAKPGTGESEGEVEL